MKTTCASMDITDESRVVVQPLNSEWYQPYVQKISMLRLDLLHPVVSGNKWYKLKHNITLAKERNFGSILTFGGAYSNHLIAAAAAAHMAGLQSMGIVRGIYAENELTPTLVACKEYGMQLEFVSREEYSRKTDQFYLQSLEEKYKNPYIIPEGGANGAGAKGCEDIAAYIGEEYTHVCVSAGTGTTLAGLRNALPCEQTVLGFVPMKNGRYLQTDIDKMLSPEKQCNLQLFDDWHFGGFGKHTPELIAFMNGFYEANSIPLDFVYTAKMMYGVQALLQKGFFFPDANILCVHTGGLQGNKSIRKELIYS